MNVLIVCGGGMSSSVIADSLVEEAKNHGEEWYMEANATDNISVALKSKKWDAVLLAPQVSFRKNKIREETEEYGIPLIVIEGFLYTPMGVPKLYDLIKEKTQEIIGG